MKHAVSFTSGITISRLMEKKHGLLRKNGDWECLKKSKRVAVT